MPVLDSPMSAPQHERGPSLDTPLVQPAESGFHASYHVQNTRPYQNVSEVRYTCCMVCGRSVDAIKKKKVDWFMRQSTPRNEPEHKTKLRREAFENGLNMGYFLFIRPAVSLLLHSCTANWYLDSANESCVFEFFSAIFSSSSSLDFR